MASEAITQNDLREILSRTQAEVADYVVEQGTSSIWTYRKWNSGIAECWGIWSGTLTNYATVGSFFGYYVNIAYPTGLFKSGTEPIVTYQPTIGSGFAWAGTHFMSGAVDANYYAVSTSSGSQSVYFSIQVKGRWK